MLLSQSLSVCSQADFTVIDTTSLICRQELNKEFAKKFELINKNIPASNASEKNVIKEIYAESQKDFLGQVNNNNFLCDANLNSYLKRLFDEILIKNKINPNDYKVLLSKDSEVNAANVGNDMFIVNYGLFLCVENEDELMFVLSHEIGHQYLNHVWKGIESYARLKTSKEIQDKTKEIKKEKYGKAAKANDLLKNIIYKNYKQSRKKEIEADSLGLALYSKTLRNPKAAVNILAKLDLVDTEKDSLTVDDYRSIFEQNGFKVKEKYFQQEESLFTKYDGEKRFQIDSLKSHPDCPTRIKLITNLIKSPKLDGFTSSKEFDEIKQHSVNQNLFNMYSGKNYGMSLYETLKLYKNDKANEFYRKMIWLNLLEIQKSRANYTINKYVPSYDNKYNTDSLNRFVTFLNNIKMTDFDILLTNFKL